MKSTSFDLLENKICIRIKPREIHMYTRERDMVHKAFHSVANYRCPIRFRLQSSVPARCGAGARVEISRHQSFSMLRFPLPSATKICMLLGANTNSLSARNLGIGSINTFYQYKWARYFLLRHHHIVRIGA
jgi:hypothetical protein